MRWVSWVPNADALNNRRGVRGEEHPVSPRVYLPTFRARADGYCPFAIVPCCTIDTRKVPSWTFPTRVVKVWYGTLQNKNKRNKKTFTKNKNTSDRGEQGPSSSRKAGWRKQEFTRER